MKSSTSLPLYGLFALLIPLALPAVTIVECLEPSGATSFRDKCPPGMEIKSTKRIGPEVNNDAGPTITEIAADKPVVLFSGVNCDACDLVRNLLQRRGIPFSEKDATEDPDIQAELAKVTDGALSVPTLTIGERHYGGYKKSELESALNDAGYPPSSALAAQPGQQPETATDEVSTDPAQELADDDFDDSIEFDDDIEEEPVEDFGGEISDQAEELTAQQP